MYIRCATGREVRRRHASVRGMFPFRASGCLMRARGDGGFLAQGLGRLSAESSAERVSR